MKAFLTFAFAAIALAEPAPNPCNTTSACPCLQLPWGNYTGTLNLFETICHYSDVRFASPPVGELRFAAPEYPPATVNGSGIAPKAPNAHMSCVQMNATSCLMGGPVGAGNKSCFPAKYGSQDEDCLFLDVYVPHNVKASTPLPVVVWIYGGGYQSGSKTQFDPSIIPFYGGNGPINAATRFSHGAVSTVFVAGNYRLGAYGWLAGTYMEEHGQPNAGLLDQSAVLQFVQDHISKVNGDPDNVSVWGESAGASSIMHHLVMDKNLETPPFKKAILQSPAYQWMWNRTGTLNDTFTDFAKQVAIKANCPIADMQCLRSASSDVVMAVNQDFAQINACEGIFPFGPAVDGKLVKALAPVLFSTGQVAPLENILVSHVDLEIPYAGADSAFSFLPRPVRDNPQSEPVFEKFLDTVFGGSANDTIMQSIFSQYPRDHFSDQIARAASLITDVSFTCHTRFIIDRYLSQKTPVYALDYAIGRTFDGTVYNASFHGSDLLPLFSTFETGYTSLIECLKPAMSSLEAHAIDVGIRGVVSPTMQEYFTNLAISGDINHGKPTKNTWGQAYISGCTGPSDSNKCVWNLMVPKIPILGVGSYWTNNTGPDISTSDRTCQFWNEVAASLSPFNSEMDAIEYLHDIAEDQHVLNWEL